MVFNALIPARSGSKRVPNKNIRDFCGKPLMVWSIEQALACSKISRTYVSTDSEEYKEIASDAGAIIIDRGDMESKEEQSMDAVLENAWPQMAPAHATIILQPTSPLRWGLDLVRAIEQYEVSGLKYLISMCKNRWQHKGWKLAHNKDAYVRFLKSPSERGWENGAIYITDQRNEVRPLSLDIKDWCFYEMPESRSFEIDTEEDWKICEIMMKERLSCSNEKK